VRPEPLPRQFYTFAPALHAALSVSVVTSFFWFTRFSSALSRFLIFCVPFQAEGKPGVVTKDVFLVGIGALAIFSWHI